MSLWLTETSDRNMADSLPPRRWCGCSCYDDTELMTYNQNGKIRQYSESQLPPRQWCVCCCNNESEVMIYNQNGRIRQDSDNQLPPRQWCVCCSSGGDETGTYYKHNNNRIRQYSDNQCGDQCVPLEQFSSANRNDIYQNC